MRARQLDGEIVCVDEQGTPQFHDLLFHRGEPCFFAFDLLMADGQDVRPEARRPQAGTETFAGWDDPHVSIPLCNHIESEGVALFKRVCEMDLEGRSQAQARRYTTERTTWFKIKNRHYSQMQGREELFERERHKEPVAGWHCCELACAEVENA